MIKDVVYDWFGCLGKHECYNEEAIGGNQRLNHDHPNESASHSNQTCAHHSLNNKQLQMLTFRAPLLQFSHLAQHGEPLHGEIKQFPAKCNHPSAKTQLRAVWSWRHAGHSWGITRDFDLQRSLIILTNFKDIGIVLTWHFRATTEGRRRRVGRNRVFAAQTDSFRFLASFCLRHL